MNNFLLYRQLKRLERECNDDLLLVQECGPEYYSNDELYDLLDLLDAENRETFRYRRLLLLTAAMILFWFGIVLFAHLTAANLLKNIAVTLFAFGFLTFLTGTILIRKKLLLLRRTQQIRTLIYAELDRRRKDASIY